MKEEREPKERANEESFDTAVALIDALRPDHDRWMDHKNMGSRWFFRGHRDATWELRPGAYRERGDNLPGRRDGDFQVFFELRLLQTFVQTCDAGGIALPGDSLAFRAEWLYTDSRPIQMLLKAPYGWPPEQLYQLIGVAQHHGVPTCLLDWSSRGMVAAYFAARDALRHLFQELLESPAKARESAKGEMAVWAFRRDHLNSRLVKVVELPAATSLNLGAQSGVFTLVQQDARRGQEFKPRFLSTPNVVPTQGDLLKLTLPLTECGRLLGLCCAYGISRAKLFPGLDGAGGMTIEAQWLWALSENHVIEASKLPFP